MTLQVRLGPYEILSAIGAGGMGEVYKARDTRLERTVAIKVLPDHLSKDEDVRRRFEREAKTISQLSHPHICALYDVGSQDGVEYLVMEYLEGETLADRLSNGALSLEQTLRFGVEIADALDKAHRQGIVHRDLKPGNVMLIGAKLGFGRRAPPRHRRELTSATTAQKDVTREGRSSDAFTGARAARRKKADPRTDIFAFGATLRDGHGQEGVRSHHGIAHLHDPRMIRGRPLFNPYRRRSRPRGRTCLKKTRRTAGRAPETLCKEFSGSRRDRRPAPPSSGRGGAENAGSGCPGRRSGCRPLGRFAASAGRRRPRS